MRGDGRGAVAGSSARHGERRAPGRASRSARRARRSGGERPFPNLANHPASLRDGWVGTAPERFDRSVVGSEAFKIAPFHRRIGHRTSRSTGAPRRARRSDPGRAPRRASRAPPPRRRTPRARSAMPRRRARSGRDARALVLAVALLASVATPCVASPGTRVARAAASDADDGTARSSRAPGRALLEPRAAVPSSAVDWSAWRYRSNDEVAAALEHLHRGPCAGTSALTSMGASGKGVPMRVLEISLEPGRVSAKPSFAFIGNMHGDEPVGRELILRLGKLLCDALREPEDTPTSSEMRRTPTRTRTWRSISRRRDRWRDPRGSSSRRPSTPTGSR